MKPPASLTPPQRHLERRPEQSRFACLRASNARIPCSHAGFVVVYRHSSSVVVLPQAARQAGGHWVRAQYRPFRPESQSRKRMVEPCRSCDWCRLGEVVLYRCCTGSCLRWQRGKQLPDRFPKGTSSEHQATSAEAGPTRWRARPSSHRMRRGASHPEESVMVARRFAAHCDEREAWDYSTQAFVDQKKPRPTVARGTGQRIDLTFPTPRRAREREVMLRA